MSTIKFDEMNYGKVATPRQIDEWIIQSLPSSAAAKYATACVYSRPNTYGRRPDLAYACVPVDAQVGDVMLNPPVLGDRPSTWRVVEIDEAIGEEAAPWYPLARCRKAALELVEYGPSWNEVHVDYLRASASKEFPQLAAK